MARYFIEFAYDGTDFHGWQVQPDATLRTVQRELDAALSTVLREPVRTLGSSRTDAGVHAVHNVAHFDCEEDIHSNIVRNLNFILPDDISAKSVRRVQSNSHARFDAVGRDYEYRISYRKNPFLKKYSCYYPYKTLDMDLLNEAARLVQSQQHFQSFSKKRTNVRSFACRIEHARWTWNDEDELLVFNVSANRFLRGMVRAIVQTSIRYARGIMTHDQLLQALASTDNRKTDFSAPANGLTLIRVRYPDGYFDED